MFFFNKKNLYNYTIEEHIFFIFSQKDLKKFGAVFSNFVYSILRIYERGVLDKIQERMLPTMPRCAASAAFHSARLTDVYSAFFLLSAGMLIAISIGIIERIWNKRKQMQETIVRGLRDHHLIPHIHFHHQHHHRNHARPNDRLHFQSPDALPTDRLRGYDSAYLTMLQNQARQVQSFVGFQERDASPEKSRGPDLEPRFHAQRRSAGLKRASWSSFSGLSKRKLRATEKIPPISNVGPTPGTRAFPFHN